MNVIIAPSLLSADYKNFEKEIHLVESLGAEWIHFDMMDGKFVPNVTFPVDDVAKFSKVHNMVNDVHIMIEDPLSYAKLYLEAGADYLTFHYEACKNDDEVFELIDLIHSYNKKAGLSIKPNTPVEVLNKFLPKLDLVLIMSVEPGFGGQKFLENAIYKIAYVREYIDSHQLNCLIEVDGGINSDTAALCKKAGVDVLVAGSYLFGHEDIKERIASLR